MRREVCGTKRVQGISAGWVIWTIVHYDDISKAKLRGQMVSRRPEANAEKGEVGVETGAINADTCGAIANHDVQNVTNCCFQDPHLFTMRGFGKRTKFGQILSRPSIFLDACQR